MKVKFDSSKKFPLLRMGVKAPPHPPPNPSSSYVTLELDSYGWQEKIPFSVALSELVLDGM